MKIIFKITVLFLTALTSCSESELKAEKSFEFDEIDKTIGSYQLEKAVNFINEQKGLNEEDSIKLVKYKEFIYTLKDIETKLKGENDFIKRVIDFQKGIYNNKVLYADTHYGKPIGNGSFLNANICLVNSSYLSQNPQDFILSCSYNDEYHNHIFKDISLISDKKKIKLSKTLPANGFDSKGRLKHRPFKFKLTEKQTELIIESKTSKIVLTTTITYRDRAYLNGTIWEIKNGDPIKYNDIATFKERKEQVLDKGEIKKFEIIVEDSFRDRLIELFEIHKILKNNNIE